MVSSGMSELMMTQKKFNHSGGIYDFFSGPSEYFSMFSDSKSVVHGESNRSGKGKRLRRHATFTRNVRMSSANRKESSEDGRV